MMDNQNQFQAINTLKGIGEKTGALYQKLGIKTVDDLLHYYPRAYNAMDAPGKIGAAAEGSLLSVKAKIETKGEIVRVKGLQILTVPVKDDTGKLYLTWYNMPYMKNNLAAGTVYVFRGKVQKKRGRLLMEQPEIFKEEEYERIQHSLQPVYAQTRGLGNKAITKAVEAALYSRVLEREYMPAGLRKKHQLAEYNFAIEHIHFPKDRQDLLFARRRLVFDEFFFFLAMVRTLKYTREKIETPFIIAPAAPVDQLIAALPFELTLSQRSVFAEIRKDLASGYPMNRLIQGDVGSGKTILAVLALLDAAYSGYQGAFMVPTEVLAKQHFESMTGMFAAGGIDKKLLLITGSMTAKEKRLAYEQLKNHEADIVIGTHALIQEKVEYHDLALVITDEQHRFGVGQREALGLKSSGGHPHVLVMSATPIPRTLALILYGDLDISVIDELPKNRLAIKNCVVGKSYRPKAYTFIQQQVDKGRQAYVICPMVEDSEMIEAENVLDYTRVLRSALSPGTVVEYLHGKMKGKEKNRIMERFSRGEIHVLVSTTVIEVGINVPNATVMMIENAERFGLAQLHQLRGRVGRGQEQSYCIMVNGQDQGEANARLEVLNRSNDGFYIASEDLKLRGPGDIFGIRQSGDLAFQLADIYTDAKLLKLVAEEVDQLFSVNPNLEGEEYGELKRRLSRYLEDGFEQINL